MTYLTGVAGRLPRSRSSSLLRVRALVLLTRQRGFAYDPLLGEAHQLREAPLPTPAPTRAAVAPAGTSPTTGGSRLGGAERCAPPASTPSPTRWPTTTPRATRS